MYTKNTVTNVNLNKTKPDLDLDHKINLGLHCELNLSSGVIRGTALGLGRDQIIEALCKPHISLYDLSAIQILDGFMEEIVVGSLC